MRSVILAAAARAFAALMAVGTPNRFERAAEDAMTMHFGKNRPKRDSDAASDPYFGIATCGRTGAGRNLQMQALAFAQTKVAKRNARGAHIAAPFSKPDARTVAWLAARKDGLSHNQALKIARRVAA